MHVRDLCVLMWEVGNLPKPLPLAALRMLKLYHNYMNKIRWCKFGFL